MIGRVSFLWLKILSWFVPPYNLYSNFQWEYKYRNSFNSQQCESGLTISPFVCLFEVDVIIEEILTRLNLTSNIYGDNLHKNWNAPLILLSCYYTRICPCKESFVAAARSCWTSPSPSVSWISLTMKIKISLADGEWVGGVFSKYQLITINCDYSKSPLCGPLCPCLHYVVLGLFKRPTFVQCNVPNNDYAFLDFSNQFWIWKNYVFIPLELLHLLYFN